MKSIQDPAVRKTIVNRINNLTPESARLWGKMNVNQMICHCTDQFRIMLGIKPTVFSGNVFTVYIVKPLIMLGLQAPPEKVKTTPELDQQIDGTPPIEFQTDLATLLALMDEACSRGENEKWYPHPAFGKMSKKQWLTLAYTHLHHHLRQFGV